MAIDTMPIDRSKWPRGPWDDEPDRAQWLDDATGLHCLAVRQPSMGHWCGYVGLPPGHPWREGIPYEHEPEVHGGITYGPSPCDGNICHVVDGEDDVRWIGFDCAHYRDRSPAMPHPAETYRTLDYVRNECASLAAQVARAGA